MVRTFLLVVPPPPGIFTEEWISLMDFALVFSIYSYNKMEVDFKTEPLCGKMTKCYPDSQRKPLDYLVRGVVLWIISRRVRKQK